MKTPRRSEGKDLSHWSLIILSLIVLEKRAACEHEIAHQSVRRRTPFPLGLRSVRDLQVSSSPCELLLIMNRKENCMKALQIFWRCRAPFSKRATYAKSNLEKKMCASVLRIPNYSCSVCHLSARVACKWAGQASSPALRPRSWLCLSLSQIEGVRYKLKGPEVLSALLLFCLEELDLSGKHFWFPHECMSITLWTGY